MWCSSAGSEQVQAELALVDEHLAEQRRKRDEHGSSLSELDAAVVDVANRVAELDAAMDKTRVLAVSIDRRVEPLLDEDLDAF